VVGFKIWNVNLDFFNDKLVYLFYGVPRLKDRFQIFFCLIYDMLSPLTTLFEALLGCYNKTVKL
jgi:hypothetical protein